MTLPLAICSPEPSDDAWWWFIMIFVALVYFGLVIFTVTGAPREARLRVAGTWLVSALAVTVLAWRLEESAADSATIVLAVAGLAAVVTLVGVSLRKRERAWPYVMAGSIGGVTPVVLVIGLLALFFATGGCFS